MKNRQGRGLADMTGSTHVALKHSKDLCDNGCFYVENQQDEDEHIGQVVRHSG